MLWEIVTAIFQCNTLSIYVSFKRNSDIERMNGQMCICICTKMCIYIGNVGCRYYCKEHGSSAVGGGLQLADRLNSFSLEPLKLNTIKPVFVQLIQNNGA